MPGRRSAASSEPAVTPEKLVRLAKQDMGHSDAARELGVSVGQISSLAWSHALVDAGRFSKQPATTASVKKLKDVEENRWELIAARTGLSVSGVKELYGDTSGAKSIRGRKPADTNSKSKTTTSKKGGAAASPRRARTRAERAAARAGNPS
jgi:hypothetical protein